MLGSNLSVSTVGVQVNEEVSTGFAVLTECVPG